MLNLKQIKIALFDCDGVLLDSNSIKTEGFRYALYGEATEDIEHLVSHHKQNSGISRYAKLQYYYRDYRQYKNYEAQVKTGLDRFSEFVKQRLLEAPVVPGVLSILDQFNSERIPCYVISGSSQGELRKVLRFRNLSDKFVEIYGSPLTKQEHLNALSRSGELIHPGIYFGDARSDFDAARTYNLVFVYIAYNSDWEEGVSVCTAARCAVLNDFSGLELN